MVSPLLEVTDLSIDYESKAGTVHALDSMSLSVEPNQLIAIVGESGCGKTTFGLSIIKLLPMPPARYTGGNLLYKGTDLVKLDREKIRLFRGTEIAMVFQEPMSSLNPAYKIHTQIEEAIAIRDVRVNRLQDTTKDQSAVESERKKQVISFLTKVRIPDPEEVANRYPFELSGGMRQRVMIAMSLAQKPSLLIADEPTTALDVTTQAQILKLMRNLMQEVKTSILLITHDLAVASQVADKIAVMYGGEVVEETDVLELFSDPLHPYTQGLLSCVPTAPKDVTRLKPIRGNVPDLRLATVGCKFAPRCPFAMERCDKERPKLISRKENHRVACHLYDK